MTKPTKIQDELARQHDIKELHKAISDLIIGAFDIKPKQVSKEPKPVLKDVVESFGFGDIGGVVNTTEDTGYTYTEQDIEDAAFEAAQPYIDQIKANLKQIGIEI